MNIALDVGFVLSSFGFLKSLKVEDKIAMAGAFLAAVVVAELPQVYVTFPTVAPWLQPIVVAIGLFIAAFGSKELGVRAVSTIRGE